MAKKYTKKYDRKSQTYTFYKNGKEDFTIFRTGFGGHQEYTGISDKGGFGFPTFYQAVFEMMGWKAFKRYMKGRRRP